MICQSLQSTAAVVPNPKWVSSRCFLLTDWLMPGFLMLRFQNKNLTEGVRKSYIKPPTFEPVNWHEKAGLILGKAHFVSSNYITCVAKQMEIEVNEQRIEEVMSCPLAVEDTRKMPKKSALSVNSQALVAFADVCRCWQYSWICQHRLHVSCVRQCGHDVLLERCWQKPKYHVGDMCHVVDTAGSLDFQSPLFVPTTCMRRAIHALARTQIYRSPK